MHWIMTTFVVEWNYNGAEMRNCRHSLRDSNWQLNESFKFKQKVK